MDGDQLTLEQAIGLLAMPRTVGMHPETKEPIQVGIGRFGPYVRMGSVFGSLDRDDDVLALGLNRAVDLIAKKMASVRTLGTHPKDKEFVAVRKGRFGPYVQHGQTVANLPRGTTMDDVTLEEAVALLAEKGKTLKPRGAAAKKGRGGRTARAGAKAAVDAGVPSAPAKARSAPRKQPARPATKAASAVPKKAAVKKRAGTKKAKKRAAM
jgi:DNA topoisomerase-1